MSLCPRLLHVKMSEEKGCAELRRTEIKGNGGGFSGKLLL